MNNSSKIEDAMNSLEHLQKLQVNPYLFEKVIFRIENRVQKLSAAQKIAFTLISTCVLLFNVWGAYSYFKTNHELKHQTAIEFMANEMQSQTTYYY